MRTKGGKKVPGLDISPRLIEDLAQRIQGSICEGRLDRGVFERECERVGVAPVLRSRFVTLLEKSGIRIVSAPEKQIPVQGPGRGPESLDAVVALTRRYVRSGSISARVVDGVARMCGLEGKQGLIQALRRNGVTIAEKPRERGGSGEHGESNGSGERRGPREPGPVVLPKGTTHVPSARPAESAEPGRTEQRQEQTEASRAVGLTGPEGTVGPITPTTPAVAKAVAAARSRMERDRWLPKPEQELLKAIEEVGLFYLIRGVTAQDTEPKEQEIAVLPPSDERRKAYETFILHNLRLVRNEAKTCLAEGFEFEDVFHYGVIGLMRAVVKFDGRQGNKFSTYATWWIRQSIGRGTKDDAGPIRFPVYVHEELAKVAKAERQVELHGRFPTAVNVALESGLSVAKVIELRRISQRVDSLDREIRGDTPVMELAANDLSGALPSPESEALHQAWRDEVRDLLVPLQKRAREIIELRMGFVGDEPQTLDAIGKRFGVTRERIRQLESKALFEIAENLGVDLVKPAKKGRKRK